MTTTGGAAHPNMKLFQTSVLSADTYLELLYAPARPDIQDTEMVSRRFCLWLAAGYITGVLPWCLIALIIKYSYIPYSVARYVTVSMGSVLLLRAWLGPEWVIKLAYSVRWLLTLNIYRRDDIGNAFAAGGCDVKVTFLSLIHI